MTEKGKKEIVLLDTLSVTLSVTICFADLIATNNDNYFKTVSKWILDQDDKICGEAYKKEIKELNEIAADVVKKTESIQSELDNVITAIRGRKHPSIR